MSYSSPKHNSSDISRTLFGATTKDSIPESLAEILQGAEDNDLIQQELAKCWNVCSDFESIAHCIKNVLNGKEMETRNGNQL